MPGEPDKTQYQPMRDTSPAPGSKHHRHHATFATHSNTYENGGQRNSETYYSSVSSVEEPLLGDGLKSLDYLTSHDDYNEWTEEKLKEHIAAVEQQAELNKRNLKEMNDLWGRRVGDLEQKDTTFRDVIFKLEEELNRRNEDVSLPVHEEYAHLRFVLRDKFTAIACAVIVANIGTMILEIKHPEDASDFVFLDHFYMLFYVVELTLKAVVLQSALLCGPLSIVWWNWLDLVIVVAGVAEMYVEPLLVATGLLSERGGGNLPILNFLRGLRLMRLARILKLVKAFWTSDLSWTDGNYFHIFIMGVILLNSIVIGAETEVPNWSGWFFVEQAFLIIFVFELTVRLKMATQRKGLGASFFAHPEDKIWNWLDFGIVAGGVFEQWLLPLVGIISHLLGFKTAPSLPSGVMSLIRMARLARIMRLVRIVKSVPQLYDLVKGMAAAMRGIFWVIVLTFLVLYIFALLAVKLIGEGLAFADPPPEDVSKPFQGLFNSFFVLFQIMNGDQSILDPLFVNAPATKFIFVAFMIITNWSILSILTAVVSENMITVTEQNERERAEIERQEREARKTKQLHEIFDSLDKDRSGDLDLHEFERILRDDKSTARDELFEASGIGAQDLLDIFTYLSREPNQDGHPTVQKWYFLENLRQESVPPTERSIMRLEKKIRDVENIIRESGLVRRQTALERAPSGGDAGGGSGGPASARTVASSTPREGGAASARTA